MLAHQLAVAHQMAMKFADRALSYEHSQAGDQVEAVRCGAHARTTGNPCRSPAMRNGRCRMHGGKAGRKSKNGRHTKAAIERRREVRLILRVVREMIDLA